LLFFIDAERAHHLIFGLAKIASKLKLVALFGTSIQKPKQLLGLSFKNQLGVAAGFDKNAEYLAVWEQLGFSFVEVGTVTPQPQDGNQKPRLFRLLRNESLINRMGFNNKGVHFMASKLKNYKGNLVIGCNIGKNKDTPNDKAFEDYLKCFQELYPFADYFTINVSSPNTKGLRDLQNHEGMMKILDPILAYRKENKDKFGEKAILVKLSPDMDEMDFENLVRFLNKKDIQGLVLTNTSIRRDILKDKDDGSINQRGGLSGKMLFEDSNNWLKSARQWMPGKILIGVGGVDSGKRAKEKLSLGADLVQVYTGLVFKGPKLIKEILNELG